VRGRAVRATPPALLAERPAQRQIGPISLSQYLVTAPPPHLAEALRDRYAIERELGRGGMARVYLAQDIRHKRPVALKVAIEVVSEGLWSRGPVIDDRARVASRIAAGTI
jgi:hypothetical protein